MPSDSPGGDHCDWNDGRSPSGVSQGIHTASIGRLFVIQKDLLSKMYLELMILKIYSSMRRGDFYLFLVSCVSERP